MATHAVATPYAKALLDLTVAQGTLSAVRDQLDRLAAALRLSRELQVAFSNPTLRLDERRRVVLALAERLEMSPTAQNFLLLLAEKGRLGAVAAIAKAFGALADERTGVLRARVVSPVEISVTQSTRLKAVLSEMTGRTVLLTAEIEPKLIGGLQVHIGGKVYDSTVTRQLDRLRSAILSTL